MSLDFQQVQEQVRQMGENANRREEDLNKLREQARQLLNEHAEDLDAVRRKVRRAAQYDPSLRCACPPNPDTLPPEALNAAFAAPPLPAQATILAADGSQIALDRHAPVEYCLINVGAIRLQLGSPQSPELTVLSKLMYEDADLFPDNGPMITDALLALQRDEAERTILSEMARSAAAPIVTFTDGPMELWGAKESGEQASQFQKYLTSYLRALESLRDQGAVAGGYVDKPSANLVARLLEVMLADEEQLADIRRFHRLRGVSDRYLYEAILHPGERSAIFAMQSQSAAQYPGDLALHFFYLNVGRAEKPWLARVEVPAWVATDAEKLGMLQAVLVQQCQTVGSRPYPYLLHRAHETAVVSMEERDQVTQMISIELRRRGVLVGDGSQKQALKNQASRTRY